MPSDIIIFFITHIKKIICIYNIHMSKSKHSRKASRCHEHHEIRCHGDCKEITAEKNLLNISYLTEGSGISGPDMSATYEIIIFNRSPFKFTNVSIVDTFLGLYPNIFGPTGTFGGELRPYFTNVSAEPSDPNMIPNTFDQIVANNGNLVACGSFIPPHSVASIIVRITGRGFLLPTPPSSTGGPANQIPFEGVPKFSMDVQNTALISGKITKKLPCHCHVCAPIFPIYVKSGIARISQGTLFNILPTPELP